MGRRRGSAGEKPKKRKRVTVKLIPRKHAGEVTEPWAIMEEIIELAHGHLTDAKLTLAWRIGWRSDANGILTLGRCRKRGDLDRELDSFDFVILLNKEAWLGLNTEQRRALIDHELCHAQIVMDSDGEPKRDDCDRLVCRIRKHDCEEFRDVVQRHGLWTSDLADIAKAAINDASRPLLAEAEKGSRNGSADATSSNGDGTASASEPSNAWKKWPVSVLAQHGLPKGKVKLLEEAGLATMGKLIDRMNKAGAEDFWWKDIRGLGEGGYDTMVNAMMALRKSKPEFQEA